MDYSYNSLTSQRSEIGYFQGFNLKTSHTILFSMKINFKTSMLEYCKIVLTKLRFDKNLFRKEYRKSFQYLTFPEHQELKNWLRDGA